MFELSIQKLTPFVKNIFSRQNSGSDGKRWGLGWGRKMTIDKITVDKNFGLYIRFWGFLNAIFKR